MVAGGGGGCRESGSQGVRKGYFLPSLGSLESLKEPRPQEGPKQGKEHENSLYI